MMKTFVPFKNFSLQVGLVVAVLISSTTSAQQQTSTTIVPELVFVNGQRDPNSSPAGQDGCRYIFANVGANLDAVIEIKGRSASNVVLKNIDISNTGWNKALQPEVGIDGSVSSNKNWWMKFRITFYKSGTNQTVKQKVSKFVVTGLDIDGRDGTLREWVQMEKIKSVSFSNFSSLTDNLLGVVLDLLDLNNNGEDHKITGPATDYNGIDTLATNLMATYVYEDKDRIDFYLGSKTGNSGVSNGVRQSSLWFKQFNLNVSSSLPVKLTDFTAKYNKTNVLLTWKTAAEITFSHYELEHSSDGTNFSTTAVVFGQGIEGVGASYNYNDYTVNGKGGLIYYRLKMVDIDQKYTYSPVRIIRLSEESKSITLATYPNPVVSDLRITLPSAWQGKEVTVELFNSFGQRVKGIKTSNSSQTETMSVAELGKGVFFVKAVCGTEVANQKIVKN